MELSRKGGESYDGTPGPVVQRLAYTPQEVAQHC
jgi:hypothetical protein